MHQIPTPRPSGHRLGIPFEPDASVMMIAGFNSHLIA
jgi:hypothetical protein